MTSNQILDALDCGTAYHVDDAVAAISERNSVTASEARSAILPLVLTGYLDIGRDRKIRKRPVQWGDMQDSV